MKTTSPNPDFEGLIREMQIAELDDLAMEIKAHDGAAWALRRAASLATAAAVGTLQRRNRMPTTMRRFIERCALGALAHAQGEVADRLRALGERDENFGGEPPSHHERIQI